MCRIPSLPCALVALALASPAAFGADRTPMVGGSSWAAPQIRTVVEAGLMGPAVAGFGPKRPLTRRELAELLSDLGDSRARPPDPTAPVTLGQLDAALVRHLGLSRAAKQFRVVLARAGLKPGKHAGTEIVARLLGLRVNHSRDRLEPELTGPVTRAETAYSVARVLELEKGDSDGHGAAKVKRLAAAFSLPGLTGWQRRILSRAVSFVGYPYVWAGTSEKPQAPLGKLVPGGFDCSGFVWRVYKLQHYPDAPRLSRVLKGRSTYGMSGEVKRSRRIPFDDLQPADLVFFGAAGPRSKPSQVGHMGIYLGNGWFIHSSRYGVTVVPLRNSYRRRFAWGRRPLAEAGLQAARA